MNAGSFAPPPFAGFITHSACHLTTGRPVLGALNTCSTALSPAGKNYADALVVSSCACCIATGSTLHHPGLPRHPNSKRQSTKLYRPNTHPNAAAPLGSAEICLNAFLASIVWMTILGRFPNLAQKPRIICNTSCITPASAHAGISSQSVAAFTDHRIARLCARKVMSWIPYLFVFFYDPYW